MNPELLQFHGALSQAATRVEDILDSLLPPGDTVMGAPMRHAVLSGGKRLRGFLAMESAAIFRVPAQQALRTAAAVECVHAYSLVHDDLPCMDDDDMRRGKPTVHVEWDEATAVLAGDALLTLAFEIIAAQQGGIDPRLQTRLIHRLALASGGNGMVAGQALDMAAGNSLAELNLEEISVLQALKTGALIGWSVESGAILGRSDPEPLLRYAADLGLAFQIQDDILDVTGSVEALGKDVGKDGTAGKATFVSVLGLDGARQKAREIAGRACDNLAPYGSAAVNLRRAAMFVVERDG